MVTSTAPVGGGLGTMGGRTSAAGVPSGLSMSASLPTSRMGAAPATDLLEQWRQPGAAVPLGELADVRMVTGPPMIKDENGELVGHVVRRYRPD